MRAGRRDRLELEADLRHALERGRVRLHYQPVVDLRTGDVTASRRWCAGSTRGAACSPPADFIPLAEETGLIGAARTAGC